MAAQPSAESSLQLLTELVIAELRKEGPVRLAFRLYRAKRRERYGPAAATHVPANAGSIKKNSRSSIRHQVELVIKELKKKGSSRLKGLATFRLRPIKAWTGRSLVARQPLRGARRELAVIPDKPQKNDRSGGLKDPRRSQGGKQRVNSAP